MQFEDDPEAFGVNTVPNPPAAAEKTPSEADDSISEISLEDSEPCARERRSTHRRRPAKRKGLGPKLVVAAAAGAAALLLGRRRKPSSGVTQHVEPVV